MWGLRAIRVGVLTSLVACVGCKSAEPLSVGGFQSAPIEAKTEETQPANVSNDWRRPWFRDQSDAGRLTPERIHGGIY